jgi:hypothetical protein
VKSVFTGSPSLPAALSPWTGLVWSVGHWLVALVGCLEVEFCPVAQAALVLGVPLPQSPRAGISSVPGPCPAGSFVFFCTSYVPWGVVCEVVCIRIDALYRAGSLGQPQ